VRGARRLLLTGGVGAVRINDLARVLRVTKGSFYWHFKDRGELLEALLREWEAELPDLLAKIEGEAAAGASAGIAPGSASGGEALPALIRILGERATLSEAGEVPSDAAIFAWAATSPRVARRDNRAEEERLQLLSRLAGDPLRGEILYLVWLGFVARGRRLPASRKRFPAIAQAVLELLSQDSTAATRR
jgi:AcrR family transcriptional regulator